MSVALNTQLEIRKLSPSNLRQLGVILDMNESWKILMAKIPVTLQENTYECPIERSNMPKYRSEHFKMLMEYAEKSKRSCTEILFDEWGTSGRVRPTLGHLLYLLKESQLYRAADFVAIDLLHKEAPTRPLQGPAARISPPDFPATPEISIERILDELRYSDRAIEDIRNSSNTIREPQRVIPAIVINEVSTMPLVIKRTDSSGTSNPTEATTVSKSVQVSDLMQFSRSDSENKSDLMKFSNSDPNLPQLSDLIGGSNSYLPQLSELIKNEDTMVPNITALNVTESIISNESVVNSASSNLSNALPEISALNLEDLPNLSAINPSNESTTVPNLSVLLSPETELTKFGHSSSISLPSKLTNSNASNGSRPNCVSPLPNLSLNTPLPHFNYCDLEAATDNFNTTLHKSSREIENSQVESNGRFLGSGAFGSVFLALGLKERPVAVKKLFLSNPCVVNIEDTVTKQFKNEVEVLSKYKHENLLSIVGYSCDGPTYCLLYEYLSGGTLQERLQASDNRLIWTDRLYVALGTARGISYLHTFDSKPLIHRDIKTANILLDCTNKPKLCDFGLIKLTTNQNTNTSTTALGTSAYMAPEAFRGDVSVKLDSFSFGVVLLELLTSLPPLDMSREGHDLITHIEEVCEDNIMSVLDRKVGQWTANDVDFAEALFHIAKQCVEEKKKRPTMVEVTTLLTKMIEDRI